MTGDLAVAELLDLLFGKCLSRLDLDPCHQFLAVLNVRDTDHIHVRDLRMQVQELLNLTRIEVLTAADDHLL